MATPPSPGYTGVPPAPYHRSSSVPPPPGHINLSSQAHNYDRQSLPTTYIWTREYAHGKVVASGPVYLDPPVNEHHSVFERALHTVAMKIKGSGASETADSMKCRQWKEDLKTVRDGTCSFQVQYLGSTEVHVSKGIQVCEDAIKLLKQKSGKKKDDRLYGHHWATMHISSDSLTVVDDETQHVLAEDSIQSISYCAAHRRNEKCFAYIARNNPHERSWTCHGFLALTATGERLSHAVGCAFEACHEKINAIDESNSELNNAEIDESASIRVPTVRATTTDAGASGGRPGLTDMKDPLSKSPPRGQYVSVQLNDM